jgi:hypothetical protein
VRVNNLDGYCPPEHALFRAVDPPHSTNTDQIQNVVAARQCLTDKSVLTLRTHCPNGKSTSWTILVTFGAVGAALGAGALGLLVRHGDEFGRRDSTGIDVLQILNLGYSIVDGGHLKRGVSQGDWSLHHLQPKV